MNNYIKTGLIAASAALITLTSCNEKYIINPDVAQQTATPSYAHVPSTANPQKGAHTMVFPVNYDENKSTNIHMTYFEILEIDEIHDSSLLPIETAFPEYDMDLFLRHISEAIKKAYNEYEMDIPDNIEVNYAVEPKSSNYCGLSHFSKVKIEIYKNDSNCSNDSHYLSEKNGYEEKIEVILEHELAHAITHHMINNSEIPLWFNEGFANSFSNIGDKAKIDHAEDIDGNKYIVLDVYALGALGMNYLYYEQELEWTEIVNILRDTGKRNSFEKAIKINTGLEIKQLENRLNVWMYEVITGKKTNEKDITYNDDRTIITFPDGQKINSDFRAIYQPFYRTILD